MSVIQQVVISGGLPNTLNGVNYGLLRLRIARMRMDWARTSIIAGQDNAFISPLSPTSFASLAVPTFGYAGNLWGWIPQVRVEHRFDISDGHNVMVQGGILDNLVGEPPYTSFNRDAQAGERSGQPAYGTRVAWTHNLFGRTMTLGAAGYYSRQDWGFNHHLDGWAGMTDWDIPIAPRVNLSGEFYRGTAVGGLGGGVGRSVLFSGIPGPATQIRALDSIGGWSQLKLKASSRLEGKGRRLVREWVCGGVVRAAGGAGAGSPGTGGSAGGGAGAPQHDFSLFCGVCPLRLCFCFLNSLSFFPQEEGQPPDPLPLT